MTDNHAMAMKLRSIGAIATQRLFLGCTVILFCALLYNHYMMITFAVPLDYNEAGMLSVTATIAEGINPYTFENQPVQAVVYPVLYNMIVAPLSSVFGNTLPLHRAVAGLFVLLSCGLCYLVVRRQGNSRPESFAASTLWYAALLYYSTPISSPNSLGVLLFFASISIPWLYHFSGRSLCVALGLGILAFYGKQYQAACLGFIALYLFLAISKKRAILFGAASLVLFLLILWLVTYTSPYFLDNTVFAVNYVTGTVSTYETAFRQLLAFAQVYSPLLVILILQFARVLIGKYSNPASKAVAAEDHDNSGRINLFDMDAPLLNVSINYFWFCFTCSLLVIVFVIGKNPANHLTYLFQIMSPFLLIGGFQSVVTAGRLKPLYYLLIVATFYLNYSMLSHDFSINTKNWEKIEHIMAGADDIYASTLVLPEVIHAGKEVYDSGHTRYFYHAEKKPPMFAHKKPEEDVTQMWTRHVNRINSKIEAREFDLILLDQWMLLPKPSPRSNLDIDAKALLQKHYYRSDRIVLNLANRPGGGAYEIQVWKPKPGTDVEQVPGTQ